MDIEFYQTFFYIYQYGYLISLFFSINVLNYTDDFLMLNQLCFVGEKNLAWSQCTSFLYILFIYMLFKMSWIFMRKIKSFLILSLSGIQVCWTNESWDIFSLLLSSEKVYLRLVLFLLYVFGSIHQWNHLGLNFFFHRKN